MRGPERTGGPARYVRVRETGGKIGFITPLTHNFCESCNRVRITCTGIRFICAFRSGRAIPPTSERSCGRLRTMRRLPP